MLEELLVWARGEDTDGFVDPWSEGTGETEVRGETPPDAILPFGLLGIGGVVLVMFGFVRLSWMI